MLKTRQFYEFILVDIILVDIDFVEITHHQDVNNLVFSKFKIQKVLTFQDMNQNPYTLKDFLNTTNLKDPIILIINKLGLIYFFLKHYDHSCSSILIKHCPKNFPT
jgi:hypothetical protein